MLDWVGSLRIDERSRERVVLSLTRSTRIAGWVLMALGAWLTLMVWNISAWLATVPLALAGLGMLLASLRRRLTFDREGGVLRIEQSAFGVASRAVVPLFHLRAVVVIAREPGLPGWRRIGPRRYIAYVERRVGEAIYLDEAARCARLLRMAEAISDVAELRLEYDATAV